MAAPVASLDRVRARRGGRSARVREEVLAAALAELATGGFEGLSHLAVARRAGVDPATVYRRWPTRVRLALDAVSEHASAAVPIPDTGSLRGDMRAFHREVRALLGDPEARRIFRALAASSFDEDPDVGEASREFWRGRFERAAVMVDRAVKRGEIPPPEEPLWLIEQLVAPAYFRTLVSLEPLDESFGQRSVEQVLRLAGAHN